MADINIFRDPTFGPEPLVQFVERNPFRPTGIGDLGLFAPVYLRGKWFSVEERNGRLQVIPFSPRGAPPTERTEARRLKRAFMVPRLAHGDTITAEEIADVRAHGSTTELMQMQDEVARRLSGQTGLQANMEYTWERHRLASLGGQLLDADGTVMFDWFDEFGIALPAEWDFDLDANAEADEARIIGICDDVVAAVLRGSGGLVTADTRVYGMAGATFMKKLRAHRAVRETYKVQQAGAALRQGTLFEVLEFGGITWFQYRGSDDGTSLVVPTDKVQFFTNAPGVFQVAYAPYEGMPWVNQLARPLYPITFPDRDRGQWERIELYSYPLHICTRPDTLQRGRAN